jgi:hypothetical protein
MLDRLRDIASEIGRVNLWNMDRRERAGWVIAALLIAYSILRLTGQL